ncbi:hypothetical protein CFE70_010397 [Pyrenophora teres f. teres 0-1]
MSEYTRSPLTTSSCHSIMPSWQLRGGLGAAHEQSSNYKTFCEPPLTPKRPLVVLPSQSAYGTYHFTVAARVSNRERDSAGSAECMCKPGALSAV